jgi:predicted small lipoprotein YifL
MLLVAALFSASACERKAPLPVASDTAATPVADQASQEPSDQTPQPVPVPEEGCGCSPSGLLARVSGLTCDEPGAQTYRLRMYGRTDGSAFPSRARVQIHHKFMGMGARIDTNINVPSSEAQQRWFECERDAGRRPALQIEFCLPAGSPGGIVVDLTFTDGSTEYLDGRSVAQATRFLELVDSAQSAHRLDQATFTTPRMGGEDETLNVLHIAGTPSFAVRSGDLGDFSGFGIPRRHRRRH